MYRIVTGGAGFIGSHLTEFLLKNYDDKIIVVDSLLTGNPENLKNCYDNPNLAISDLNLIQPVGFQLSEIRGIYHFASPASPVAYSQFPIATLMVNAMGTKTMLDSAKEANSKFMLASSSEVYGDPLEHPQNETYWGNTNPIGPKSVYSEGKRYAEAITMAYHNAFNIDTSIARIFNTYGPKMKIDDGRVIPNFITRALKNEPLTIFGNGEQTRSFCYIDDLVTGIDALFNTDEHMPVNIGNSDEISILDLAELIIKLTSSNSKIEFKAQRLDDPAKQKPDITKMTSLTGWKPQVSLEDGLKRTIAHFKNEI